VNRFSVCFVCTGNICRSPMAETVLRSIADASGHGDDLVITSAGTGDWHVGEGADPRTEAALVMTSSRSTEARSASCSRGRRTTPTGRRCDCC
jgi:protein-tyrosine-phosphatase